MKPPMFRIAEVKSTSSDNPNGEFEIVMSTDSVDRDGEIIVKGAFDPLPASIPVHAFHNFDEPVGRAFPSYDGEGRLVGRGFFGSDPDSQRMRQKVADGLIGHTSVGFMAADRDVKDGVPHITKAELLEVSFVSVPSNRDAAVTMVKSYTEAIEKAAEQLGIEADLRYRVEELEVRVKSLLDTPEYKRWLVAKLDAKAPMTDRELNAAIDADAEQKAAVDAGTERQERASAVEAHIRAAVAAAQAATVL